MKVKNRCSDAKQHITLKSLSRCGSSPCVLLKWPNFTLLVDCAVNMRPLVQFLPSQQVPSKRFESLPAFEHKGHPVPSVKQINKNAFVDARPEILPFDLSTTSVGSVDAILIGNSSTLLGVPFLSLHNDDLFRATVYVTDAAAQFGKLQMEEFLSYFEQIDCEPSSSDAEWRKNEVYKKFPNGLPSDPTRFQQMYDRTQLERMFKRVKTVTCNEIVELCDGCTAETSSAGSSVGSVNWILNVHEHKIVCLCASSSISVHPRSFESDRLRNADALLLTSLTQAPSKAPEKAVAELCKVVVSTLRDGGNVLIPCSANGVLYDLFECVNAHMLAAGLGVDSCMYWLSPVSDSFLAYAQIFSNWLHKEREEKIYKPEEPFVHSELIKTGRLKIYPNMAGDFSREFRQPSVVFCGHESLRLGDAVHFMNIWADNKKHALVLIDSGYSMSEVIAPYEPLGMRAFYCPIDTNLDYVQASELLQLLKPAKVFYAKQYTQPPVDQPNRPDFVLPQSASTHAYTCNDEVAICDYAPFQHVTVDSKLDLPVSALHAHPDCSVGVLHGELSLEEHEMQLNTIKEHWDTQTQTQTTDDTQQQLIGHLTKETLRTLVKKTVGEQMTVECEDLADAVGFRLALPQMYCTIEVKDGVCSHVIMEREDPQVRLLIRTVLAQCLQKLP